MPTENDPGRDSSLAIPGASVTVPAANSSAIEPRTLPPQDPQRFVDRLGRYVLEARDQGRQLSVQIAPPDLGPLRIDVTVQQGELSARLTTESTVAQQLLQEHLPQLHEALQQLGANVERIDVVRPEPAARDRDWERMAGVGTGLDWSASSGQSSPDRREDQRRPPPTRSSTENEPKPATPAAVATGSMQELNIRI